MRVDEAVGRPCAVVALSAPSWWRRLLGRPGKTTPLFFGRVVNIQHDLDGMTITLQDEAAFLYRHTMPPPGA